MCIVRAGVSFSFFLFFCIPYLVANRKSGSFSHVTRGLGGEISAWLVDVCDFIRYRG